MTGSERAFWNWEAAERWRFARCAVLTIAVAAVVSVAVSAFLIKAVAWMMGMCTP